ncbi:hypothetical protein NEUTE1DRAFT_88763 [Neurospora tetrasperma FGSC 2508]|uniref:Uncharacterized protein n=1 Tax=Neurospora tetrasperma (strain FGSC 2508 / ATCC MYA-4615 / P0657) TaxID=510951 RepID=F8MYG4_NEUT8|nr:uncharacterized protein NEUTE1DRAFT_88763 [Neurospora tetrasperma FGSC 2508]EGO51361.1 hypothetical protein NEUTE1DRAFT_88763 [Neurospora tetrasperma FGSC 2508]EGZ78670.1 hypothetical protein NEUTE2DRAFT_81425 [Neurospora tetrasperma FGSC 2509]
MTADGTIARGVIQTWVIANLTRSVKGMEEPQRVSEGDIPIAKETSEKEPSNVDNNADVKNAAKPMKDGQNDNNKSDRGAPRIIMAYIPASAPASPPAPGRNNPEASNGGGRPETPNLTAKLNQAIDEYRAREERVGELGQPDEEGYKGDTYSQGEHQGCCDHDHENQFAAHDEQYSPLHLQQGYNGHSSSVNAPGCWTPYHPASSAPLYMQPPFGPPFQQQQQQQQQYAVPYYPPVSQPYSFSFPSPHYFSNPHDYRYFPNPHHHQHFSTTIPPPTHPFAPPARPSHFQSIPPHAHPFPPHHPQSQDPNVLELTQRLHNIQAQLNGLDAAHEVEIWRHGKYNFHRRRAKQLRKIKREKVEEMVTVVRELRALGVEGYGRRHHQPQPQGQQETWTQEMMGWTTAPGWGYGAGFEPGWGGHQMQEQWLGGGYGYGHGHGHGHGQSKVEVEVEHNGKNGRCGCDEDGAHVDSPPTDSAVESMACECPCGCTTVDGEAVSVGEMPGRTRARALSLDGMREQVEVVEAYEKQHGDGSENKQGESAEKNSSCARAGSWSDAEVVISEELRGTWRKKMRE